MRTSYYSFLNGASTYILIARALRWFNTTPSVGEGESTAAGSASAKVGDMKSISDGASCARVL